MEAHGTVRLLAIALTSICVASGLVLLEEPVDADAECCDHLFYRAQSVEWLGLDEPGALSIPAGNRLEQVYDDYYYDRANGLTRQPPYVYRVAVPVLAGTIGKLTGIDRAYRIIHFMVLAAIAFLSGFTVLVLSEDALTPALSATLAVLAIPQMARSFADNYMIVDPASVMIVSLVLLLTVRRDFLAASLVAAIVAPLVKETLVPMALSVALAAWMSNQARREYWVLALVPFGIQLLLRRLMSVATPPSFAELFVLGDPYLGVMTFTAAFAPVIFLVVGLGERSMRHWILAFLPLALMLLIVTTSAIADGPRIWMTFWPVLLAVGLSGLWRSAGRAWLGYAWTALLLASAGSGSLSALRPDSALFFLLAVLFAIASFGLLLLHGVSWLPDASQAQLSLEASARRETSQSPQ